MKKLILDLVIELIRRGLKGSIMSQTLKGTLIGFLSLQLMGCLASGGGAASSSSPGGPAVGLTPTPVSVSLKTGAGFECVGLADAVYCRTAPTIGPTGVAGVPDHRLNITSLSFALYAATANAITRFETWDSTVCITTSVAQRPFSRVAGTATYCWGSASLGANAATYPMVYSPPYVDATNGAPEVSFAVTPFVGYDGGMEVFTDEGGTWLVMTDTANAVVETVVSCTTDGVTLTCPTFGVSL